MNTTQSASDPTAIDARGHERQLRNFAAAIRGEEKLLVDGEAGRKPVELILGIYESAKTGKPIRIYP